MKNQLINTLVFILLFVQFSFGQSVVIRNQQISKLNDIPKERVFVHYNSALLFSGETLYYSFYTIDYATNVLSNKSKVGYVDVIDSEGITVFSHKINLDRGRGQGDFFIPTTLDTGVYRLIGYTNWMKNEGLKTFYNSTFNIINPYKETKPSKVSYVERLTNNETIDSSAENSSVIQATLSNTVFNTREIAKLNLTTKDYLLSRFSLSIRKISAITSPIKQTALGFYSNNKTKTNTHFFAKGDTLYLPEFRGEIIQGKLMSDNSTHLVSNKEIVVSTPGIKNYEFKKIKTNNEGDFLFTLSKGYNENDTFFKVARDTSKRYQISIGKTNNLKLPSINEKLTLSSVMEDVIKKRSVYAQINNAYSTIVDSLNFEQVLIFDLKAAQDYNYNLDDYKRFPSFKDTAIEILDNVYLTKSKSGESQINIRNASEKTLSKHPSMVLVDGIYVENHNDIMDLDTRIIKKITILNKQHIYGSSIYNGILLLETLKGNYFSKYSSRYLTKEKLFRPQPRKKYLHPNYGQNKFENRADFRQQLYWQPDLKIDKDNSVSIEFYTSDNVGNYEIAIEGFTRNGEPITLRKYFEVE